MERNTRKLDRGTPAIAKGRSESWTIPGVRLTRVSVLTREDAGVDTDEPWVASCDTHGEMLGCSTKENAKAACRVRDWCSGCMAGWRHKPYDATPALAGKGKR